MTETSSELTPPSSDTINVLPILSEAKAPVSLTLTIDKSISKVAGWVIGVIIANAVLMGICAVLAVWMTISYQHEEREARMVEYYLHEVDGKLISAGFLKPSQNFDNFKREHEKDK